MFKICVLVLNIQFLIVLGNNIYLKNRYRIRFRKIIIIGEAELSSMKSKMVLMIIAMLWRGN